MIIILLIYLIIAVMLGGLAYGILETKEPDVAHDDDTMCPLVVGSVLWPIAIIVIIGLFVGRYLINIFIKVGHKIASKF